MSTSRLTIALFVIALVCFSTAMTLNARNPPLPASPALGRPATTAQIAAMDLTITAEGGGLPRGSGSVSEGAATFAAKCAMCHGDAGKGDLGDQLTGGRGSLTSAKPVKSVASYWPYAPTLFDYIRRAMPLNAPQTLSDSEVYGLVAYLLSIDAIVPGSARLDAKSLALVKMPNRAGFRSLAGRHFDGNIVSTTPAQQKGSKP